MGKYLARNPDRQDRNWKAQNSIVVNMEGQQRTTEFKNVGLDIN